MPDWDFPPLSCSHLQVPGPPSSRRRTGNRDSCRVVALQELGDSSSHLINHAGDAVTHYHRLNHPDQLGYSRRESRKWLLASLPSHASASNRDNHASMNVVRLEQGTPG